jgi:hypothetical protein
MTKHPKFTYDQNEFVKLEAIESRSGIEATRAILYRPRPDGRGNDIANIIEFPNEERAYAFRRFNVLKSKIKAAI